MRQEQALYVREQKEGCGVSSLSGSGRREPGGIIRWGSLIYIQNWSPGLPSQHYAILSSQKAREVGIVIIPISRWRSGAQWIPTVLTDGTQLQDGLLQSHPFLPCHSALEHVGCLDCHLSAQRSLCVKDQESEGVWHKPILAWVQSAEKRNNLQTLMVCHGMANSVKGPITPLPGNLKNGRSIGENKQSFRVAKSISS